MNKQALTLTGWLIPLVLIGLGAIAITVKSFIMGLILVGGGVFYLATYFKRARSPDVLRVFSLDRYIGKMNPGLYVEIPGLFRLEPVTVTWYDVEFSGQVYVLEDEAQKDGTRKAIPVYVSGYFQFCQEQTAPALEASLLMPPADMSKQAGKMCLTQMQQAFGDQTISEALSSHGAFEQDLKNVLRQECAQHGYKAGDLETNFTLPTADTEAEGRARGRAAASVAQAVEGNWPAAAVSATAEVTSAYRDTRNKTSGSRGREGSQLEALVEEFGGVEKIKSALSRMIGKTP